MISVYTDNIRLANSETFQKACELTHLKIQFFSDFNGLLKIIATDNNLDMAFVNSNQSTLLAELYKIIPFYKIDNIDLNSNFEMLSQNIISEVSYKKSVDLEAMKIRLKLLIKDTAFEVVQEISKMFISNYEKYSEKLNEFSTSHDIKQFLFNMHNLKSTSGNLGAVRLAELCLSVESLDQTTENYFKSGQFLSEVILFEYRRVKKDLMQIVTDLK